MEDIRVAKDKRMKKVAIGLSVVFVAVLAYEVLPHVLHSGGSSAAAAPAVAPAATTPTTAPSAPTAATSTATPATTPPGTAAAAVTPTATSTKLTNSDRNPNVGKAQLYSFSQFSGRDPFAQQIDATAGQPSASGQDAQGNPTQTGSSTTSSTSGATAATGTTAAVTRHRPTRTLAVTGAARIAFNGRVQVVRVGASFPSANPLFRLVSVTNGVAKIGIATGSYSSGAKTVSLRVGRLLTLVDTADGIRYQIRLVS
ncbi:MAG TPA: hypothetical protein VGH46_10560 [Gaiellaceae bacterium]|jgi:hypothetical protein